jgi:hypothetical protein
LPHLRKIAIVDIQIRFGEANFAAGMRVIPAHRLESTRSAAHLRQNVFQALFIARRERERGSEGMLAVQRLVVENLDLPVTVLPEQDPSDFQAPARHQEIGVYDRKTNLLENQSRVEDLERRLRRPPAVQVAVKRLSHRGCLLIVR